MLRIEKFVHSVYHSLRVLKGEKVKLQKSPPKKLLDQERNSCAKYINTQEKQTWNGRHQKKSVVLLLRLISQCEIIVSTTRTTQDCVEKFQLEILCLFVRYYS